MAEHVWMFHDGRSVYAVLLAHTTHTHRLPKTVLFQPDCERNFSRLQCSRHDGGKGQHVLYGSSFNL